MEKVDVNRLRTWRIILLVVFAVSAFGPAVANHFGGKMLIGGWFPMFYVYLLLFWAIVWIAMQMCISRFYPEKLFTEEEGEDGQ